MEYLKLGNTGLKISKMVLGTMQVGWRIDEKTSFQIMDRAYNLSNLESTPELIIPEIN